MNITLTSEQEKYIQLQLECGKYNSIEQLISEALQLLEEQNRALEQKRSCDSLARNHNLKGFWGISRKGY